MNLSPTFAGYLRFAFGAWAGHTGAQIAELLMGKPLKMRTVVDDGSSLPVLIFAYAAVALLCSSPFAAWQSWRRRRSSESFESAWLLPLVCGLIYMPLFGLSVPYLCRLAGEGQGGRIGSLVMLYILGMPVVFAELCLRLSRKSADNNGKLKGSQS